MAEEEGLRFSGGKPPYHLLPPEFLRELAGVLGFGAHKYAPHNYELGLPIEEYLRGAMSHWSAMAAGQTHDIESGLLHSSHAAWNMLAMSMEFSRNPNKLSEYQEKLKKRRKDAPW
jgi:Domain of unknown function (DUF5664)